MDLLPCREPQRTDGLRRARPCRFRNRSDRTRTACRNPVSGRVHRQRHRLSLRRGRPQRLRPAIPERADRRAGTPVQGQRPAQLRRCDRLLPVGHDERGRLRRHRRHPFRRCDQRGGEWRDTEGRRRQRQLRPALSWPSGHLALCELCRKFSAGDRCRHHHQPAAQAAGRPAVRSRREMAASGRARAGDAGRIRYRDFQPAQSQLAGGRRQPAGRRVEGPRGRVRSQCPAGRPAARRQCQLSRCGRPQRPAAYLDFRLAGFAFRHV